MIARRRALRLCRIPALALPAAAPGLAAVAGLGVGGFLAPEPALVAALFILVTTVLVVGRLVVAVGRLDDAIGTLAAELPRQAPPVPIHGIARAVDQARHAILRLARAWRERLQNTQTRLGAAEAIVAAVPDPLI
ncbi:MAG: hypothetical protein ACREFA_09545, partial [Stellaceae bacterium]